MVFLILIPALKILPGEILDCRHRHCAHACFNFLICASIYRQKYITISVEKDTIFGAVFSGLAGVIALTTLSILHDRHDIHILHQQEDSEKQTARAIKLAARGYLRREDCISSLTTLYFLAKRFLKKVVMGATW